MNKTEKKKLEFKIKLNSIKTAKLTLTTLVILLLVNTLISTGQLVWYIWSDVMDNAKEMNEVTGVIISIFMITLFVVHMVIMSGCFFSCLSAYQPKMLHEESVMLKGLYKMLSIKLISIISLLIYLACFILSIVSLVSPLLNVDPKSTGTVLIVLIVINSIILTYVSSLIFYYRFNVKKHENKIKKK